MPTGYLIDTAYLFALVLMIALFLAQFGAVTYITINYFLMKQRVRTSEINIQRIKEMDREKRKEEEQ